MNAPQSSDHANDPALAQPGVLFARTQDDLLVAKVGDNAFAMMPSAHGRFYLASAWRLRGPMEQWTRSDFYSMAASSTTRTPSGPASVRMPNISNSVPRSGVGKSAPVRIRPGGPRRAPPSMQTALSVIRPLVTAASISMPPTMRRSTLPCARRTAGTRKIAPGRRSRRPSRVSSPITNSAAPTGPSETGIPTRGKPSMDAAFRPAKFHEKDRRNFERDHSSNWVVISAIRSDQHPGMTECVATLGGNRRGPEQRRYLVPSDEYDPGRFGFVIDEVRHRLYGGPSSFAGWR